jgi:arylsulfatase A-like enzyme
MKFTQAYAASPLCSPTRASLMTGQSPARLHLTNFIPGDEKSRQNGAWREPDWTRYLAPDAVTLAELLKKQGYVTGIAGKWHLANVPVQGEKAANRERQPDRQGFDEVYSVANGGHPPGPKSSYFGPFNLADHNIDAMDPGKEDDFITERLADRAVAFIEKHQKEPFFFYLPFYAPHTPIMAREAKISPFKDKPAVGGQNDPAYAGLVAHLDESVGRVHAKLAEFGLMENTLILFMSDNGGFMGKTDNAPLRDGKASAYEGGVREPMFAVWKGVIKPGTECTTPVISTDFPPTILDMLSLPARPDLHLDGISFAPLLRGQASALDRDTLFWHYPHWKFKSSPFSAIRKGDWRLVENLINGRVELYNLKDDIGETKDLSKENPEQVAALLRDLHAWREKVGAQMPEKSSETMK